MTIGVLALQGDFKEHLVSLQQYGIKGLEVRTPEDLKHVDGLILPGGESTTMAKLLVSTGLDKAIRERAKKETCLPAGRFPMWGTCAGAIVISKSVISSTPLETTLGLIDITVERNSYGRQTESFQTDLSIGKKSAAVFFIRAPRITKVGKGVKVLAKHAKDPVLVQQGNILVSTFHSELTRRNFVLEYFVTLF